MTGDIYDHEQALRVALENSTWEYPDQIEAVARLAAGIALLNETADAETAVAALAEITGNSISRRLLEKAAVRYAYETENSQLFRQGELQGLIDMVTAAKEQAVEIDRHARRFLDAGAQIGIPPKRTERARGGGAYFQYLELEAALKQVRTEVDWNYGKDQGGKATVSEKMVGTPFDRFTETLAELWRANGRDFGPDGMRDFETITRALSEKITGQDQSVRWWKDQRRKLKP